MRYVIEKEKNIVFVYGSNDNNNMISALLKKQTFLLNKRGDDKICNNSKNRNIANSTVVIVRKFNSVPIKNQFIILNEVVS
mmetsp:Transcript_4013/g.7069  ORF Transcript_4013/g.7069 Transcript_4013/m.7069 type:complete len:81 (-) Transcript_4013:1933-2175(-)